MNGGRKENVETTPSIRIIIIMYFKNTKNKNHIQLGLVKTELIVKLKRRAKKEGNRREEERRGRGMRREDGTGLESEQLILPTPWQPDGE